MCLQSSQVAADSNVSTNANKTEEKVGEAKYSSHSLDEVAGMLQNTLLLYESKVNTVLHISEIFYAYTPFFFDVFIPTCE